MILLLGLVVGVASAPLLGGSLRAIGRTRLRGAPWMAAAIVVQEVIPALHDGAVPRALHVASFALAAVFIAMNWATPGLRLVSAGGLLNFVAIVANGGVMPASPHAWWLSGAPSLSARWFSNARPIAHGHLAGLGDVIALPAFLPGAAPFSIGDTLIVFGLIHLVHHLSGAPWAIRTGVAIAPIDPFGPVTSTTERVQSFTEGSYAEPGGRHHDDQG